MGASVPELSILLMPPGPASTPLQVMPQLSLEFGAIDIEVGGSCSDCIGVIGVCGCQYYYLEGLLVGGFKGLRIVYYLGLLSGPIDIMKHSDRIRGILSHYPVCWI